MSSPVAVFTMAVAGGAGALLRWRAERHLVMVNAVGCLVAGLVVGADVGGAGRLVVVTGLCGGLTTFSGWALPAARHPGRATWHVAVCLAAAGLGLGLGHLR